MKKVRFQTIPIWLLDTVDQKFNPVLFRYDDSSPSFGPAAVCIPGQNCFSSVSEAVMEIFPPKSRIVLCVLDTMNS